VFINYNDYTEKDLQNLSEIQDFLDYNNIEYSTEYENFCLYFGNPDGKRSYEIQYVPARLFPINYPKFNIQGVPKDFFYKWSYRAEHDNNSFMCFIKDYEWNDHRKREVLKSYILYAANKIKKRFYARECEVRVVQPKEARAFELENCFYGKRGASLSLGLYTKKEKNDIAKGTLVMLYTFGKNFFGKDNSIEVLRVGTIKFCQVIGGASKLLKHFIVHYQTLKIGKNEAPVNKIKFYSDYDHNIGNSMDSLGFKFLNYSKGGIMNYWILEDRIRHREPSRHKEIMNEMKNGNVIAVPTSGVKTFVLDVDEYIKEYNVTRICTGVTEKLDNWL